MPAALIPGFLGTVIRRIRLLVIDDLRPRPSALRQTFDLRSGHNIGAVYEPISLIPHRLYLIAFLLKLLYDLPHCRPRYLEAVAELLPGQIALTLFQKPQNL